MRFPPLIMTALAVGWTVNAAAAASVATAEPGVWSLAITWVMDQQRLFHHDLADHLRALEAGGSIAATWALVTVSFLYGVFHAAGPGHGKAVIATYLVTHESRLWRGVGLAVASALCQGLVAVSLVYGLIFVAGWLPREMQSAVAWTERISFALLAAMGLLFAARALAGIAAIAPSPPLCLEASAVSHQGHDHGRGCGCNHGPTPRQIEQAHGMRASIAITLSVGLRPCSGAVLVLALANVLGLAWAGIAAVAAMSAGTAITVAGLAVITVKARHWAAALFTGRERTWHRVGSVIALVGGVAIFLLGVSLLIGSFGPAHPLTI